MKPLIRMLILCCLVMVISGCSSQNQKTSKSTEFTQSSKASTAKSSVSGVSDSDESEKITSGETSEKATIEKLATIFAGEKLPTLVYGSSANYLGATYTTPKSKDYQINYFATDRQLALNDGSLDAAEAFATFKKQEFSTDQEAIDAVGYLPADGLAVNLNHGITGYQQGAAGSTYLAWQEGNWSLVVQTTNSAQEDPIAIANSVIDLLENIYLPAPTNVGQITIHLNSNYQLVFNQNNMVYTLTHSDYLALLKMAASMQ